MLTSSPQISPAASPCNVHPLQIPYKTKLLPLWVKHGRSHVKKSMKKIFILFNLTTRNDFQ